ncbi:transposase [Candidatus Woesearchaeota archaeon]|nr:transposase [Candidatus Woesearchaeota archaeon]
MARIHGLVYVALCTKSKARTLELSWKGELLKQQARENLESEKGKDLRKRRGNEIESVFGDGKLNKSKDRYLLRGLSKVNIEAGLYYISHNLRKIQTFINQKMQTPN